MAVQNSEHYGAWLVQIINISSTLVNQIQLYFSKTKPLNKLSATGKILFAHNCSRKQHMDYPLINLNTLAGILTEPYDFIALCLLYIFYLVPEQF